MYICTYRKCNEVVEVSSQHLTVILLLTVIDCDKYRKESGMHRCDTPWHTNKVDAKYYLNWHESIHVIITETENINAIKKKKKKLIRQGKCTSNENFISRDSYLK